MRVAVERANGICVEDNGEFFLLKTRIMSQNGDGCGLNYVLPSAFTC